MASLDPKNSNHIDENSIEEVAHAQEISDKIDEENGTPDVAQQISDNLDKDPFPYLDLDDVAPPVE